MVTSIEEMKKTGGVAEVTLSGWDGEKVVMKLRRPSLYEMAASGRIPNPLLGAADALFMMNAAGIQKTKFDDTAKMVELIAREALVEPTFDQLSEAGLTLTDLQYLEIYTFVTRGPKGLERFRQLIGSAAGQHGAADAHKSLGPAGH